MKSFAHELRQRLGFRVQHNPPYLFYLDGSHRPATATELALWDAVIEAESRRQVAEGRHRSLLRSRKLLPQQVVVGRREDLQKITRHGEPYCPTPEEIAKMKAELRREPNPHDERGQYREPRRGKVVFR